MSKEAFPAGSGNLLEDGYIEFILEHSPVDTDAYIVTKAKEINSGEPTWVVRNFDSDARVYDFYVNGQPFGFVDQEDQTADVYIIEEDGQPALEYSFDADTLRENLVEAKLYLEKTVAEFPTN